MLILIVKRRILPTEFALKLTLKENLLFGAVLKIYVMMVLKRMKSEESYLSDSSDSCDDSDTEES